ncbi:hypothetical protein [Streptomyces sp. NPDC101776]|uniref:hypothetical protein n=1 Tax=Streptomyces sp. NPDC101776 TaxID=3366146 RepID=UPI0038131BC3
MDWIAPLSTLGGAVVGVGAALFADRFRWRRDDTVQWRQTRRLIYVDFLVSLSRGHSNMRSATFRHDLNEDRIFGVMHEALDGSLIWQHRQSLSLTAPSNVIHLAIKAGKTLEGIRDALIADPNVESEPYLRARAELWLVNAELRESMRIDLEMEGPPDPELGAYRFPAS